jgi:hypothetical protein
MFLLKYIVRPDLSDHLEGILRLLRDQGVKILPEIKEIHDLDILKTIQESLKSVNSREELRSVYRQ